MENYLIMRQKKLNNFEKHVILIFDEIYVYQSVDYCNGSFVGLTTSSHELATSVLTLMIKSVSSKYSDVIAIVPLCGINVNVLSEKFYQVLHLVSKCGFHVVAVLGDNHPVNRSFFKVLSNNQINEAIDNPAEPGSKLFLLLDPTHTIKNIYNNFQKSKEFAFIKDETLMKPTFSVIKILYEMERGMSLRMAHKLNQITVKPTNIQRTSAKLAMNVFHESTVAALKYYAENGKAEFSDTYLFVNYLSNLLKIVNTRISSVGKRKNDPLKLPISTPLMNKTHQTSWFSKLCKFI